MVQLQNRLRVFATLALIFSQWNCSAADVESGTLSLLGPNRLYVGQTGVFSTTHSGGISGCASWAEENDDLVSSDTTSTFEITEKPDGSTAATTELSGTNPVYYAFSPDRAGTYELTYTYTVSVACDDGSDDSASESVSIEVTVENVPSSLRAPTVAAEYATSADLEAAYPNFAGVSAMTSLRASGSQSATTVTFSDVVLSSGATPVTVSFTTAELSVDYGEYVYNENRLSVVNGYDTMTVGGLTYDLDSPYGNNSSRVYVGDSDGDGVDEILVYSRTFEAEAESEYRYRKIVP